MIFVWFLLFLAWPVAEIAFFVETGRAIGWVWTILLTFVTTIAGSLLMRIQGVSAMNRFLQGTERGEVPVAAVIDGMGIFTAGVLLLLPGFLSDILGLLLFIPPLRRWLIGAAFRQIIVVTPTGTGPRRAPFGRKPAPEGFRRDANVVDAEFETVDPKEKGSEKPTLVNRSDKESP
jgi:UPF0716 protein FxsA